LGQSEHWPDTIEKWFDHLLTPARITFKEFARGSSYSPQRRYRRYEEKGFGTFSGKVELVPSIFTRLGYDPLVGYQEPPWSPVATPELAKEYPLILISGSRVRTYHHSSHRQFDKVR
jgi:thiosulfate reductase / polysulfide reductase chain A